MLEARNDLEERAQRTRGRDGGAADEGVGLAGGEHHRGEIVRVPQGGAGLGDLEALGTAQLLELRDERLKLLAARGLDDAHALQVERKRGRRLLDDLALAEQD